MPPGHPVVHSASSGEWHHFHGVFHSQLKVVKHMVKDAWLWVGLLLSAFLLGAVTSVPFVEVLASQRNPSLTRHELIQMREDFELIQRSELALMEYRVGRLKAEAAGMGGIKDAQFLQQLSALEGMVEAMRAKMQRVGVRPKQP